MTDQTPPDTGDRSVARWVPAAAIAALVVGVVVVVALVATSDDDDDVATDATESTSTSTTTSSTTTSTTAPPSTETTPPDPDDPIVRAENGLVIWPRDSRSFGTAGDAATAFAQEVLGDPEPLVTVTADDDSDARIATATVQARGEGGGELDRVATELQLVVTDSRWDIVEAFSSSVAIDRVAVAGDPLIRDVAGSGTGFEGTGMLTSTSWCDPEAVTTEIVALGAGPDPADFTASIAVPDCPVVIIQLKDAPGADGATPALASLAVEGATTS